MLELLEGIIRVPIFYQIAVFALQLSIFLYEIEVVSMLKYGKITKKYDQLN